jgi:hypothetical protein
MSRTAILPTTERAGPPQALGLPLRWFALRLSSPWFSAAAIFIFTRLIALAGAYSGINQLIAEDHTRNKGWLAELSLMWDAAWYAGIALHGYTYQAGGGGPTNVAFAPLFPFLDRTLAAFLHMITFGWDFGNTSFGTVIAAGLIISNVSFYFALFLLIRLLVPRFGPYGAAMIALGLSALPTAFFFSALYTEGLFLLLVMGSFSLARSEWRWKWLCAGLVGMLASLDRFAGLVLFPVLVVEYMAQQGWRWRRIKPDILWTLLVPAGIGLYASFLWLRFGSVSVLAETMQTGWNHHGSLFFVTYWESLSELWQSLTGAFPPGKDPVLYYGQGNRLYIFLDLALPLILLLGAFVARKRLLASEWVWLTVGIIYPLSTNITFSLARYVLPLWPGLLWLGEPGKWRRILGVALIIVSLGLMAWGSSIYGDGRWIG